MTLYEQIDHLIAVARSEGLHCTIIAIPHDPEQGVIAGDTAMSEHASLNVYVAAIDPLAVANVVTDVARKAFKHRYHS